MKYKVEHAKGIDIVEADDYSSTSLGIMNVVTFLKHGEVVARYLRVKNVEKMNHEL